MGAVAIAMKGLVSLWNEQRGGRYRVHRGAVNWAQYPFDQYPHGVAVMLDDISLVRRDGFREGTVGIEIAQKLPDHSDVANIDDDLLDEIRDDVETVVAAWEVALSSVGDQAVFIVKRNVSNISEFSDSNRQIQGLVVILKVGL